jgi:predicted Zn-dependent protease
VTGGARKLLAASALAAALALGAPPPADAQQRGGGRDAPGITQEEAQLGREQHEKVLAQFGGPYEDPELRAYVEEVGQRLLDATEFRGEDFTFTLLNSDVVNAFALPGGYVYVSRGLLALARDEAELAGVMGHEIGHVRARHTASRMQRAGLGQLGAVGAQVLGGLLGGYLGGDVGARLGAQVGGQAGALGAQAWVQGFSREQEFEAAQLGIQNLKDAGYDPRAMASFLGQLRANDQLEAATSGSREAVPGWLRSHPRTEERVARASEVAAEEAPGAREQDRERFLAAIDGMVYGDDPAQGFVHGRTFEHPELGFRFTAPEGFVLKNTPAAVIGQDRQGRIMQFDMARGRSSDPEAFVAREWGKGGQVQNVQPLRLRSGLDAAAGFAQVEVNRRQAEAMLVAIEAGGEGQFYRFMFADTRGLDRADVRDFEAAAGSFQRLSKDDASAFRPLRIEIHTVRPGETQEDVARLMAVEQLPLETFRVINGLQEGQELRAGEKVKVIARG